MNGVQDQHCHRRCISWTAIVTGALVGIGLTFLLNLFNIAIGVTAFNFTNNAPTLVIGGFLALLISTIVSMFASGYVAGFLGRPYCHKRNTGWIYGFVTWTLALVLTAFLSGHVGRFVHSYSQFVTDPTTIVVTEDRMPPGAMNPRMNMNNNMNMNMNMRQRPELIVAVDKATTSIGIGAFILFVLFAVGAFCSCLGGVYGMSCADDVCSGRKM